MVCCMKPFFVTIVALLLCSHLSLLAQNWLEQTTTALNEKQWESAIGLFSKAVEENADKAEMYFWTRVDKRSESATGMLEALAVHHVHGRNFDKAYLFYKELTRMHPENVNYLAARAEAEAYRGKEENAVRTYEQVLMLDPNHLHANIFVGNYYFIEAENSKEGVDKEYKRIASPTRMQHANYKERLAELYQSSYEKAKNYLQNAVRQGSSLEIRRTLKRIESVREKVEK